MGCSGGKPAPPPAASPQPRSSAAAKPPARPPASAAAAKQGLGPTPQAKSSGGPPQPPAAPAPHIAADGVDAGAAASSDVGSADCPNPGAGCGVEELNGSDGGDDAVDSAVANAALWLERGRTCQENGEPDDGLRWFARAVATLERVLPDSPGLADAHEGVGLCRQDRGDVGGSLRSYERCLAVRERVDPGSLETANAYNNFGTALQDVGDHRRALVFYERCRRIEEKLVPRSLALAATYRNMSNACRAMGDVDGFNRFRTRFHAARAAADAGAGEEMVSAGHLVCQS